MKTVYQSVKDWEEVLRLNQKAMIKAIEALGTMPEDRLTPTEAQNLHNVKHLLLAANYYLRLVLEIIVCERDEEI